MKILCSRLERMDNGRSIRKGKLKAFFIRYYKSALFIVLIFFLFKRSIVEYLSPVYYEVRMTPGETQDSVKRTAHVPTYLKVRFETDRAFLPNEKIKVTASLMVVDSFYQARAKRPSAIIMISLLGSEFTKNSINENNKFPAQKLATTNPLDKYIVPDGAILLKPTKIANEYEGTAEVIYRKKGSYYLYLVCTDAVPCVVLDQAIDIESSAEVMNKRSNDLLFLIAVLTFMIWLYSELFRKRN